MGNRILKESICVSDNLDLLTLFQENFFYRLLVKVDDYGRLDARLRLLAVSLYPLKEISTEAVEETLQALEKAELIRRYQVNGKPYLQVVTWERHQTIRNQRSKYPGPEEELEGEALVDRGDGSFRSTRGSVDLRNRPKRTVPAGSTGEAEKEAGVEARSTGKMEFLDKVQEGFEEFWEMYPNKKAREAAVAAYAKLNPNEELRMKMLEALKKQCACPEWQREGGRYIPYPANWITGHRWEDEGNKRSHRVIAQQYEQRDYSGRQQELMKQFIRMNGGGEAAPAVAQAV